MWVAAPSISTPSASARQYCGRGVADSAAPLCLRWCRGLGTSIGTVTMATVPTDVRQSHHDQLDDGALRDGGGQASVITSELHTDGPARVLVDSRGWAPQARRGGAEEIEALVREPRGYLVAALTDSAQAFSPARSPSASSNRNMSRVIFKAEPGQSHQCGEQRAVAGDPAAGVGAGLLANQPGRVGRESVPWIPVEDVLQVVGCTAHSCARTSTRPPSRK